ncbi:MAG: hypothetical protein U1F35_22690 [Steroidobacteraceae bacterium]
MTRSTLVVSMAEMGPGVLTSLAQLLADDLEVDWRKVRVEQAVDPAYNNPAFGLQGTGRSTSVRATTRIRCARPGPRPARC